MALPLGLATTVAGFFGITLAIEIHDRARPDKRAGMGPGPGTETPGGIDPTDSASAACATPRGTPADGAVAIVELFDAALADIFDAEMNPSGYVTLAVAEGSAGLLLQHDRVLTHLKRLKIPTSTPPGGLFTCINLRQYLEEGS